jgi:putative ABC transport system permease protein
MILSYLKIALKVLVRRKFFTFISLFGISFTLMVLLLGAGFVDIAFSPQAPESNLDRTLFLTNMIMKGGEDGHGSEWWSGPGYRLLDHYTRDLPGVELMSIYTRGEQTTSFIGDEKTTFALRRSDGAYWRINDFQFLEGGPFTDEDDREARMVAVISEATQHRYFGGRSGLDQFIETGGQRFRVVGIVADVGLARESAHADIWVPIHTTPLRQHMDRLMGGYQGAYLAGSRDDYSHIRQEFQSRIKHVDFPDPDRFDSLYGELNTRFERFTSRITDVSPDGQLQKRSELPTMAVILVGFLLLPVINLVSINASRIIERTSEIGVRKAFGASSRHLVGQFVVENIVLCAIGGLLGLLGAFLLTQFIIHTDYIPDAGFGLNYRIFGYGFVLATLFGVITGTYPAWRMSRLHPVAALRGDNR